MGFCTRRVPAGFDYGFGFIGFHIETEFRVLSGSGIVKSQKFGFGFLRVSKKRPKPVGFSGSGKPDPPLLFIAVLVAILKDIFTDKDFYQNLTLFANATLKL